MRTTSQEREIPLITQLNFQRWEKHLADLIMNNSPLIHCTNDDDDEEEEEVDH